MKIKINLLIPGLTFCVNDVETMDDIKTIIKLITGISTDRLQFVCAGKLLDHVTSLADQNIRDESIMYVFEVGFQIFVRNLSGKTITIDNLHNYDTIAHVMNKIEKKDGVPCWHQLLLHAGKRLDPKKTLDAYGIKKDSTLFMGSRLMSYSVLEETFHSIPEESTMAVKTSDTIGMLKKKIMDQFFSWIPTRRLLLSFNGKILNNYSSTLMVNNIQVGSIINLMLAPPPWVRKRKRGSNEEEEDEKAVCKKIRLTCEIGENFEKARRQRLIDEEIQRERHRRLMD